MVEEALACLEQADSFTAVEFLNQQPQPTAVAAAYNDVVKTLYWEKRNISGVVAMGRAGIQYCSDKAEEAAAAGDMEKAFSLRSAVKQLAYNVASYTWPGWNEADLAIEQVHIEAGLDAAKQNLRLALELDKGDLPISRAYWMIAGHLLTMEAYAGAEANFLRAEMYAKRAGAVAESMLSYAFGLMAFWMLDPENSERRNHYYRARMGLADMEDGKAYQKQLDDATKVVLAY